MATRLSDTHPDAERVQIEILRQMPVWRRMEFLDSMIVTGRDLALSGLQERFPHASPEELRRRLATLMLGPAFAAQVYGPEPKPPTIFQPYVSR